MALFDLYPYLTHPPNHKTSHELCYELLRYLSMGFYLASVKKY